MGRMRNHKNKPTDVFAHINMHDGDESVCWEWKRNGRRGKNGEFRPIFMVNMEQCYAYRLVWELYNGRPLGKNEKILHTCDNTMCCNPIHLKVGSQFENMQDMKEKKRVVLSAENVRRVMMLCETEIGSYQISAHCKSTWDFTIDPKGVRLIRARINYKHIPWEWGDSPLNKYRKNKLTEFFNVDE